MPSCLDYCRNKTNLDKFDCMLEVCPASGGATFIVTDEAGEHGTTLTPGVFFELKNRSHINTNYAFEHNYYIESSGGVFIFGGEFGLFYHRSFDLEWGVFYGLGDRYTMSRLGMDLPVKRHQLQQWAGLEFRPAPGNGDFIGIRLGAQFFSYDRSGRHSGDWLEYVNPFFSLIFYCLEQNTPFAGAKPSAGG